MAPAIASKLVALRGTARHKSRARLQHCVARYTPKPGGGSVLRPLFLGMSGIRTLLQADGVALAGSSGSVERPMALIESGRTPNGEWIERFAAWSVTQAAAVQAVSTFREHASGVTALGGAAAGGAAGVLSVTLARGPAVVVLFFRNENETDEDPERRGACAPWTANDLRAAAELREAIARALPDDQATTAAAAECQADLLQMIRTPAPLAEAALEASPEGILTLTEQGGRGPRLRYANAAFLRLIDGENALEAGLTGAGELLLRAGLRENLLEQALVEPRLVEAGMGDFGRRELRVSAERVLAVRGEGGNDCLFTMTFADLTASERAREQLEASQREIERAVVAKSTCLTNMSHDIRTPMNGILGTAQILTLSTLTPEQRECVDLIQRSGEALMTIVGDVLDYAKMEAGQLKLERAPFDLSEVMADVAEQMRPLAAKKNLALQLETRCLPECQVVGDAGRLQQVLLNLASNAIKFTHSGEVRIGVTGETMDGNRRLFHFEVRDTGSGIAPGDVAKLFQQFQQVNAFGSRKYGGSGLGLAVSKHLVELMGGSLSVIKMAGPGSCFQFDLVLGEEAPTYAERAPRAERRVAIAPRTASILLADDNEINRVVTRKLLGQLGYSLEVAVNGREAVEKWASGEFTLILMDCQMPEMDGFEATACIREQEKDGRYTPVIALTANALQGDRQHCLEAGMDDYLSKPIELESLRKMIDRWTEPDSRGVPERERRFR